MAVVSRCFDFRIWLCIVLLISALCESKELELSLDVNKALQYLSPYFLSITLDPIILVDEATGGRQIKDGMDSVRMMNMAKGLSPAFLRLGGPSTDDGLIRFQAFTEDEGNDSLLDNSAGESSFAQPSMTVNGAQLTLLNNFAEDAGLKLILSLGYDLDKQRTKARKRAKGLMDHNDNEQDMDSWDTKQALDIIRFANSKQMDLGYQLGYEARYVNGSKCELTDKLSYTVGDSVEDGSDSDEEIDKREAENAGLGLGLDLVRLRTLVDAFPQSRGAHIFSPGICLPSSGPRREHQDDHHHPVHHHHPTEDQHLQSFLQAFVGRANDALTAVVLHPHDYHVDYDDKEQDKNNERSDAFLGRDGLINVVGHSVGRKPICIGERWTNELGSEESQESRDFEDALVWAKHLGKSARMGANVVLHSPKVHALQNPNTQYWVSLLHKKLAGVVVLETRPTEGNYVDGDYYAHCTPHSVESYPMVVDAFPRGSVTLYAVNPGSESIHTIFRGFSENESVFPMNDIDGDTSPVVYEYILTEFIPEGSPENYTSGTLLNGKLLEMEENGELPYLVPNEIQITLDKAKKGSKMADSANTVRSKTAFKGSRPKRSIANKGDTGKSVGDQQGILLVLPAKSVAFWVLPPSTGVKPCFEGETKSERRNSIPGGKTNRISSMHTDQSHKTPKKNWKSSSGKTGSGITMREDIKDPYEAHQCSVIYRKRREIPHLTLPITPLEVTTPRLRLSRPGLLKRLGIPGLLGGKDGQNLDLRSLLGRRAKFAIGSAESDLLKLKSRLRNQRTKIMNLPKVVSFDVVEEAEDTQSGDAYEKGIAYLSEEKIPQDKEDYDDYGGSDYEYDYVEDDLTEDDGDVVLEGEEGEGIYAISSEGRTESMEVDGSKYYGTHSYGGHSGEAGIYPETIAELATPFQSGMNGGDNGEPTRELFEAELLEPVVAKDEGDAAVLVGEPLTEDGSSPGLFEEAGENYGMVDEGFEMEGIAGADENDGILSGGGDVGGNTAETPIPQALNCLSKEEKDMKESLVISGETYVDPSEVINDPYKNDENRNYDKASKEIFDPIIEKEAFSDSVSGGEIEIGEIQEEQNQQNEELYTYQEEDNRTKMGEEGARYDENEKFNDGSVSNDYQNYDKASKEIFDPIIEEEAFSDSVSGGEIEIGEIQKEQNHQNEELYTNQEEDNRTKMGARYDETEKFNDGAVSNDYQTFPAQFMNVDEKILSGAGGSADSINYEKLFKEDADDEKQETKQFESEFQSRVETEQDHAYDDNLTEMTTWNPTTEPLLILPVKEMVQQISKRRKREAEIEGNISSTTMANVLDTIEGVANGNRGPTEANAPQVVSVTVDQLSETGGQIKSNGDVGSANTVEKGTDGSEDVRSTDSISTQTDESEKSPPSAGALKNSDMNDSTNNSSKLKQRENDFPSTTSRNVLKSDDDPNTSYGSDIIDDNYSIFESIKQVLHGSDEDVISRLARASTEIKTPSDIARRLNLGDRVVYNLDPRSQQLQSAQDNDTSSSTTAVIDTIPTPAISFSIQDGVTPVGIVDVENRLIIGPNDRVEDKAGGSLDIIGTRREFPWRRQKPLSTENENNSSLPSRPARPRIPSFPMRLPKSRSMNTEAPADSSLTLADIMNTPTSPPSPATPKRLIPALWPARPRMFAAPSVPKQNLEPSQETIPEVPTVPSLPVAPTRPTLPTRPARLRMFAAPSVPKQNLEPSQETIPEVPTVPSLPVAPTRPTLPTRPARLRMFAAPSVPKQNLEPSQETIPEVPTVPSLPVAPTRPTLPRIPARPRMSATPSVPKQNMEPSQETTPEVPTMPSLPVAPTRPTMPTRPARPRMSALNRKELPSPGVVSPPETVPTPDTKEQIVDEDVPKDQETPDKPKTPYIPSKIDSPATQEKPTNPSIHPGLSVDTKENTPSDPPVGSVSPMNLSAALPRKRPLLPLGQRASAATLAAREQERQQRREMEIARLRMLANAAAEGRRKALEALASKIQRPARDVGDKDDGGVEDRASEIMKQLSDNVASPFLQFWQDMKARISHLREGMKIERDQIRRRRSTDSGKQEKRFETEKRKLLAAMAKTRLEKNFGTGKKKSEILNVKNRIKRDILGITHSGSSREQYHGMVHKLEEVLRKRRQLVKSQDLLRKTKFRAKRDHPWDSSNNEEWPVDNEFMYYPSDGSDEYTEIRTVHDHPRKEGVGNLDPEPELGSMMDTSYFAIDTARRGLYPIGPYGVINHLYAQGELYKLEEMLHDSQEHATSSHCGAREETAGRERSSDKGSTKGKEGELGGNKAGKTASEESTSKESAEKSKEADSKASKKKNLRRRRKRWAIGLKERDTGNGNQLEWDIAARPVSYDLDLIRREKGMLSNKIMKYDTMRNDGGNNVYLVAVKDEEKENGESLGGTGLLTVTKKGVNEESARRGNSMIDKMRMGESRVQKIPLKEKSDKRENQEGTEKTSESSTSEGPQAAIDVANSFMSYVMNNMTELINFFRSMMGLTIDT